MEEKTTWDAVAGPSNTRIESSPPDVPQNRVDLIVLSDSAPNTDLETMSTKDGAGEKDQYYLERAPVWRVLVHLCVPMMLALSAIALGLPVLSLAMAIGGVFGVGGGAYISRLLGEKDTGRIKHVSAFVLYGSLLLGVILTVICFIFLNPLVHILGTDQQSFLPTQDYVSVLLLFLPVLIANFAVSQIVRAIGAARQAMNGMILNVTGAALSIALSNMASLVYYLLFLQMRDGPVKLAVKYFLVTKELLKEVFGLFSSSHDVVSFGSYILTAMLISTLFNGFTGLIIAYFQTTNKPLQTTIMSFAQGGLFIPVILVAQALAGLSGIVWSMTITEAITCLIGIGLFTFM